MKGRMKGDEHRFTEKYGVRYVLADNSLKATQGKWC